MMTTNSQIWPQHRGRKVENAALNYRTRWTSDRSLNKIIVLQ
jgi:hypothetical protein